MKKKNKVTKRSKLDDLVATLANSYRHRSSEDIKRCILRIQHDACLTEAEIIDAVAALKEFRARLAQAVASVSQLQGLLQRRSE